MNPKTVQTLLQIVLEIGKTLIRIFETRNNERSEGNEPKS